MQLEAKTKTLKMEGIPTLGNMADLGTKRLSRQRREFLMLLIGGVERMPRVPTKSLAMLETKPFVKGCARRT